MVILRLLEATDFIFIPTRVKTVFFRVFSNEYTFEAF